MKRLILVLALMMATTAAFAAKTSSSYSYSRVDNKAPAPSSQPRAGVVLMGGGTDVAAAFQWMCDRSGNGDFLVLRATGTDAYNTYLKKLCPKVNSIATLIIPTRESSFDPKIESLIRNAEAIFIAGGDQSNYINFWKETPVQDALNDHIRKAAPIGGTSAGMMVLTQYLYPALAPLGVTSSQALADPFNDYMSIDMDFVSLPILSGILGDSHFVTRDRMGRDLAFLCRVNLAYKEHTPRAISVDEATALLIDEYGIGSVKGESRVYFMEAPGAAEVCQSQTPLTYKEINVYRLSATSDTFNLKTWSSTAEANYKVSAEAGVLTSTQIDGSPY